MKKSQQTPDDDLDLAVKRKRSLIVKKRRNKHLGSSFDDFLVEEGIYEEVSAVAWKRVLSCMNTSRSQLERFLDPENPSVLLETVQNAAANPTRAAFGIGARSFAMRGAIIDAARSLSGEQ